MEFKKAIQLSGNVTFTMAGLGRLYAGAGKSAEAQVTYLKVEPRLDTLRGDTRFNNLLRRVRLIPGARPESSC